MGAGDRPEMAAEKRERQGAAGSLAGAAELHRNGSNDGTDS